METFSLSLFLSLSWLFNDSGRCDNQKEHYNYAINARATQPNPINLRNQLHKKIPKLIHKKYHQNFKQNHVCKKIPARKSKNYIARTHKNTKPQASRSGKFDMLPTIETWNNKSFSYNGCKGELSATKLRRT